jgi:ABC-type Mn2+/Zn2+ transport system permease subunit
MMITPAQVATAFDNSATGTIVYSLTVSQTNGPLGNLSSGVTWTVDNPLFAVVNTMANSCIYYLTTNWTGQIADGPQTVDLTASALVVRI